MKKKIDWNAPMTRKDWAVVYVAAMIFYVVIYTWMIFGGSIISMIKKLIWKEHKNPVEELKDDK